MADLYLDRDNQVRWRLKQDGQTVTDNRVTRATVRFPGEATPNDEPLILDTDNADGYLALEENDTVVVIQDGAINLKPGVYQTQLTVFDVDSPDGLAWAEPVVRVHDWPLEE